MPANSLQTSKLEIDPLRTELSAETKQTFQVVALLATVFVVAIHYSSAAPTSPAFRDATFNQLCQSFLNNGIARVAVPLFAFSAGFFYFLSDQGTRKCYLNKLRQRSRTLLIPYLIISAIGVVSWALVRQFEGDPVSLSGSEFFAKWIFNPPSVQLWFLRDLLVLVTLAPLLGILLGGQHFIFLSGLAVLWTLHIQPFPMMAAHHALDIETLFFFCCGATATRYVRQLVQLGQLPGVLIALLTFVWCGLIVVRIATQPNFDSWYANEFMMASLLLQKTSILVGMVAMWSISWQLRFPVLCRLSGLAFFVYLVHEFPLRVVLFRISDRLVETPMRFWIVFPVAVIGCFVAGYLLERMLPTAYAIFTGGRTSQKAVGLSQPDNQSSQLTPLAPFGSTTQDPSQARA